MKLGLKHALVVAGTAGLILAGSTQAHAATYGKVMSSGGCVVSEDIANINGFNHMRWYVSKTPGGNGQCHVILYKGGADHYDSYISSAPNYGSWAGDAPGDNDQACVQGINSVTGQPLASWDCGTLL